MEEVVKRHILESLREKYHRAGKLAKGELLKEVQELLGCPPKARYPCDEASATWQKSGRKKAR